MDQDSVRKLIAGPTVFICNECIEVCNDIIADDARAEAFAAGGQPTSERTERSSNQILIQCALCRIPVTMSDGLSVRNREFVCFGCIDEIEATIADRQK